MRRLIPFALLTFVILIVYTPSTAAPYKVTYQLTGGTQWTEIGQPWTANEGPIVNGTLVMTLSVNSCDTPQLPGYMICIRDLNFTTALGSQYNGHNVFSLFPGGAWHLSRSLSMLVQSATGMGKLYIGSGFYYWWFATQTELRTSDHVIYPNNQFTIRVITGTTPITPASYVRKAGLRNFSGQEIYPTVPSVSVGGRLTIGLCILITPLVVLVLRRRAASATRRSS